MNFSEIILLIIFIKSKDFCQIGCLKCETNQKICLLCDFRNFYFLENGLCIKNKIKNCALSFQKSKCEVCEETFYSKKKKCKKVKKEDIIENCQYYDKNLKCTLCLDGYFLKKDICEILENPIDDCINYDKNGNCSACRKGVLYEENCLFNKKMIQNEKCYLFNQPRDNWENEIDIDFINLNKNENNLDKIKIILKSFYKSKLLKKKFQILKDLFPKCQKFEKYKIDCLECKKGYYLDVEKGEKSCKKSPTKYYTNCKHFQTKTECRECKNGFYLDEKKDCKKILEENYVKNCLKYNSTTKLCKECNDEFFLKSNICNQREIYIENCKEYKKMDDDCKICHYNFYYEKKISKCLISIPNCEKHIYNAHSQFCIKCSKNLAPSNNKKHCIKTPLIKNCESYSSFFKCQKCKEGFYKKKNKCFQSPDVKIKTCLVFNKDNFNCKKCPLNTFNINFFERCLIIKIENCDQMENGVCMDCKDFYFLDKKNNICKEGRIMNCKKYLNHFKKNEICIECDNNFVLENNTCRKKIKVFSQNCENSVSENCILCKSGFFPISLNFRETEENIIHNLSLDKKEDFVVKDKSNLSNEEVYRYLNTLCQITHFEFLYKTLKFLEKINHYSFKDKQKNLRKIIDEIKLRKDFNFKETQVKKNNTDINLKNDYKKINNKKIAVQANNIYQNILLDTQDDGFILKNKKFITKKSLKKKKFSKTLEKNINNEFKKKKPVIFENKTNNLINDDLKKISNKKRFDFEYINTKKKIKKEEKHKNLKIFDHIIKHNKKGKIVKKNILEENKNKEYLDRNKSFSIMEEKNNSHLNEKKNFPLLEEEENDNKYLNKKKSIPLIEEKKILHKKKIKNKKNIVNNNNDNISIDIDNIEINSILKENDKNLQNIDNIEKELKKNENLKKKNHLKKEILPIIKNKNFDSIKNHIFSENNKTKQKKKNLLKKEENSDFIYNQDEENHKINMKKKLENNDPLENEIIPKKKIDKKSKKLLKNQKPENDENNKHEKNLDDKTLKEKDEKIKLKKELKKKTNEKILEKEFKNTSKQKNIKKVKYLKNIKKNPNKMKKEISEEGRRLQSLKISNSENSQTNSEKKILKKNKNFQICSENNLYNSYINTRNCIIFNNLTNNCEFCKEDFGIIDGKCEICDQFDLSGKYCLKNLKNENCLLSDENLNCYYCKENVTFLTNEDSDFKKINLWIDRKNNLFVVLKEKSKNCGIEISKECRTKNCRELIEIEQDVFCCKNCQKGKTGIVDIFKEKKIIKSCNDYIDYCQNKIFIKNIPLNIRSELSCFYCNDSRILKINNIQKKNKLECIKRLDNFENCYLIKNNVCLFCEPGYKMVNNKCKEISNCQYSQKINKCELCKENYVIDPFGRCIKNNIKNCLKSDDEKKCYKCKNGFIKYRKKCFNIRNNICDKYEEEKCINCKNKEDLIIKISLNLDKKKTSNLKTLCTEITKKTHINGCIHYKDINYCIKCQKNFVLKKIDEKKQICENNFGIKNCDLIDNQSNCLLCSKGYYPIEGICLKGEIRYCELYINKENCSKCKKNYYLIPKKKKTYCYLEPNIKNCINFNKESFLYKGIKCEKCVEGYYKKKVNFENQKCFESEIILNCEKYENNKCFKCVTNHYLNEDGLCIFRRFFIENCEVYKKNKDSCLYCEHGYYFDKLNQVCVEISDKIKNCKEYKNDNKCKTCKKNFYLYNNKCSKVKRRIIGCQIYKNYKECALCKQKYFLNKNNICILKILIKNCMVYNDNGICKKCESDFFLKDKICEKVIKKIGNCQFYTQDNLCNKCKFPFTLRNNKCINIFGMEQDKITYIINPICIFCEPGYVPGKNNLCEKIIDHEGCAFHLENGACFVCASGYYQNSEGRCTKNYIVKEEKVNIKKKWVKDKKNRKEEYFVRDYKEDFEESLTILVSFFWLTLLF